MAYEEIYMQYWRDMTEIVLSYFLIEKKKNSYIREKKQTIAQTKDLPIFFLPVTTGECLGGKK